MKKKIDIIKIKKRFHKKRKNKYKTKYTKKRYNIIKKILAILFLSILFFFNLEEKKVLIGVDISKAKGEGGGGPKYLIKSISKVLNYGTKKCKFIKFDEISPHNLPKKINYFYFSYPSMGKAEFEIWKNYKRIDSLLLGPNFAPANWYRFPNPKYWGEKNFREILLSIKGMIVHSTRVRDHLATRSNTTDLLNKFIILRPCTFILPKDIETFENRKVDIILFEKYKDANHRQEGAQLFELFKNANKTIERLVYGYYKRDNAFRLANNTKYIIYFSFYDAGPLALKEIQNYGVILFAHQKDFIMNNKTGYHIPELEYKDMKPAFNKIMKIMDDINKIKPDAKLIAKINKDNNRCERALDDVCNGILNN